LLVRAACSDDHTARFAAANASATRVSSVRGLASGLSIIS
jgi:hypothetical protein